MLLTPFPRRPGQPSESAAHQEGIVVLPTAIVSPYTRAPLEAAGFALVAVESENAAQRFMEDAIPAAVLVGWSAGRHCFDLVHWIRTHDRLAFVQTFVLTSDPSGPTMGQAIRAGADDCLDTSRVEPLEIVDCILARIARARTQATLALLDPLTGLHNRRFMNDRLHAEIARAGRARVTLSLALLDLDDFKNVNDTLGHSAGDRVLATFARTLGSSFRSYDLTCRFGGDEFVVLFPDCDAEQAALRLEELRARLAGIDLKPPLPTFTAGISTCPGDGGTWDELFEVADRNLRAAKEQRPLSVSRPPS